MRFNIFIVVYSLLLGVLAACSTEKNTLINRTYHSTTARYNGYFNANELITMSMNTYRSGLREDYDEILPINPLPNEEEVLSLYPAIDTAIVKCTKVITNHSMPTAENPSKKKVEYNTWIDENWTMIGVANFYRRDYDGAIKNFEYVRKFFGKDPSNYKAALWQAKAYIETKQYNKAGTILEELAKVAEEQQSASSKKGISSLLKKDADEKGKKKKKKKVSRKKRKKQKEEEKVVEFPEKIRFELEKTKADLALRKGDTEKAITYLEESLKHTKKKPELARVHFILGQLYARDKQNGKAKEHFTAVLKKNPSFEMGFNARIQRAFAGGDEKIKKEFEKMLRDQKNAEYKDQIYYALAEIAFQEGNKEKGIEYLHKSTFYSVSNAKQKGKSYEKLGDLSYTDRDFIRAQKYYDSCSKVIPETYPNAEGIKNKALKLQDLVKAVETAMYEDSVQRIAQLSPKEREEFAEKLIKQIKKDEEERKRKEAVRLAELQSQQANFNQAQGGSKWYWNNARTRSDGFDEFRKQWGQRENEDNWRRSEKIVEANFAIDENGEPIENAVVETKKDSLTVDQLLKDIPLTDSAILASNLRLVTALYDAGIIYKEQLNEVPQAAKQFDAVLKRNFESDYNLLSSYQLYKIYESSDETQANEQKGYILTYYPNSDYANYLRDPNYFIKRKEIEQLAEQDYVTVLERYNRGLYYPVITKADMVIDGEPKNPYRSKYMLLKALSLGQMNVDKQPLIPILNQVVAEYPGTPEEAKAKEMLDIIKNGYSANIEAPAAKTSLYKYEEKKEHWVIIFLDEKESANVAKVKVTDFNKEFFSRDKLQTTSKIFSDKQSVISVKGFPTEADAEKYMRTFKNTRKYLLDLQKAKVISINQDNMKILFETKKVPEYELFYLENY